MKQFIVLCVSLPIMLALLAQFSLNEINNTRLYIATAYINASKELAKEEGYFSDENCDSLKSRIANLYGYNSSEVIIEHESEDHKSYRNSVGEDRYIYYKISFPSGQRLVTLLSKDGGYGNYVFEGYAPSELLK